MKQKSILLGLVMGLTLASQETQSLGMGSIQVHSALDQPLRASIDLLMGEEEDLSNLTVKLASKDDYKKVGLDRSFVPSNINVSIDEENPLLIKVSSSGPITEPIVSLLLDVDWEKGRIFREFTILLDPPVYNGTQSSADSTSQGDFDYQSETTYEETAYEAEPVAQTRAEASVDTSGDDPVEVVENYSTPDEETYIAETVESYETNGGSVEVMSGDTLWSLASRNKPSALSTNQMMMALYNNNPEAFTNNNINQMIKGSRLMIPTASELENISQADALDMVRSHNDTWTPSESALDSYSSFQTTEPDNYTSSSDPIDSIDYGVELAGNTDQEDSNGGQEGGGYENLNDNASAEELYNKASENADLKERLSELEGIVEQQQEALEIKSDDLANLENQLADDEGTSTPVSETDDVWGDDSNVSLSEEEIAATGDSDSMISDVSIEETADDPSSVVVSEEVAQEVQPVESQSSSLTSTPARQEESMVDKSVNWVMGNLQWLALGLLGLLALIFVPKFLRSRNSDDVEETSFLDDIKSKNAEKDEPKEASSEAEDTKINEPLNLESEEVAEPVADDVLADLEKEIDFAEDEQDDDEDIFKGFDEAPEESLNKSDDADSDDGFDLDSFLSDDDVESETEVDSLETDDLLNDFSEDLSDELDDVKEEIKEEIKEEAAVEESFDIDEDFDFDLSELDDLDEVSEAKSDDLSEEIDNVLDALSDDKNDDISDVLDESEDQADDDLDFSLDEDFEFDLDSELDGIADDADDAVDGFADAADEAINDIADNADDVFDEVLDLDSDINESLEVQSEADDSELDLGLDLDDMLDDGDVIDTKLDLAKAYLEMGDKEGAKNLLKEVSAEGNGTQIEDAKKLLDGM